MVDTLAVRVASPGDGTTVGRILLNGFEPHQLEFTIWVSDRIGTFLDHVMEDYRASGYRIYVMNAGCRSIGALVLRHLAGCIHPVILAVERRYRRVGLGTILLEGGIRAFAVEFPCEEVIWDVAADQPALEKWYERLGGTETGCSGWWVKEPSSIQASAPPYKLKGLEQAQRSELCFGFSSFAVARDGEEVEVGRLPRPWFRVVSREALEDPCFLSALHAQDPSRGILHIGSTKSPGAEWRLTQLVRRRRYDCKTLLKTLAGRVRDLSSLNVRAGGER